MQAQPCEILVEILGTARVGEIAIRYPPIRDGAGDAMDELADGLFSPAVVWVTADGDVAIKILGNRDLGGEFTPSAWNLDVLLAEHGFTTVVGDFGGASFPLDFVEWGYSWSRETGLEVQSWGA